MPPVANYRRTTTNTIAPADNDPFTSAPRRTATGRAIRLNTTRPTNYYARPYGSFASAGQPNGSAYAQEVEPGFFPAIQFFSDAITALPKEAMRQFTLMKEVEAKIHGPNQKIGEIIDSLLELPVPSRTAAHGRLESPADTRAPGLPSLTANNSTIGSANVSVINGMAGGNASAQNSIAGSIDGETENRLDFARRRQYYDLRVIAQGLLANLDEKNAVLAEANRVMSLQLQRVDSVLPHIDNEISEDARLGSMTHWAYSDNRQKKQASGAHSRAVQATNALASAANAFHEAEITQARRDAGREATREKQKSRMREHLDSDFDDRPRKSQKLGKPKPATPHATGLGITTNGDTAKRKKIEKPTSAAMERSSSNNKANKALARESPRSTPTADLQKKSKGKPGPLPKKKLPNSASNSPALVSSPLHNSFNPANIIEPPTSAARPHSSRLRQNSSSNLRHEKLADENPSRLTSIVEKQNGNGKVLQKRRTDDVVAEEKLELADDQIQKTTEKETGIKSQDLEHTDADGAIQSRSGSQSGRGAHNSNHGTPRLDSGPEAPIMARSRSTRTTRGNNGHESSSSEPQQQGPVSSHKRALSNSHLVRQLAPYNRSPDLDRHHLPGEEDDDIDSVDANERAHQEPRLDQDPVLHQQPLERKSLSRRNTGPMLPSSPGASDNAADDEDETMLEPEPEQPAPGLVLDTAEQDFDEDDSEHDPDDPNEPKYCYCNRGSYGEMVACDNENCAKEWFHLGCTELTDTPGEEEVWYCRDCRPKFEKKRGGRGTARGRAM